MTTDELALCRRAAEMDKREWFHESFLSSYLEPAESMRQHHPLGRAKRNPKNLVSVYDDIWRKVRRSWKEQRRKQWK